MCICDRISVISGYTWGNIIYEDQVCIIIEDISPQAPVHYLAVPKKMIKGISDLDDTEDTTFPP